MLVNQAVVLVSGGMDSVAALCWAKQRYRDVQAILFDYGQPNRDMELPIAGMLCDEMSVVWLSYVLADAFPRTGILRQVTDHDGREDGLSPAIVIGRNLQFCLSGAARAVERFPNGNIAVVLGVNGQDAKRFPDCHRASLEPFFQGLRAGLGRHIELETPWYGMTKTDMLRTLDPVDLGRVARSWSCYRHGEAPCGTCSACVLRDQAFTAVGLASKCIPVRLHGGDPARLR